MLVVYVYVQVYHARARVAEALAFNEGLESLISSLKDAETGQRGYLLTGREEYLAPYNRAITRKDSLLSLTEHALTHVDRSGGYFNNLAGLVNKKYVELSRPIELQRRGERAAALAVINTDKGKLLMDSIRTEIRELLTSEDQQIPDRRSRVRALFDLLVAILLVNCLGLVFTGYYLYQRLQPLVVSLLTSMKDKDRELEQRLVTERKAQQLIAELRRKNEDLDYFAYIASHDLQEPLRTVSNFINILKEDNAGRATEEDKVHYDFINKATERMQLLITNLLHYSQLGNNEPKTLVDLEVVYREVTDNLNARITARNATLRHGGLPKVYGHRFALTQLFQNLISNALKFSSPDRACRVEVTGEETDAEFVVAVRDNGVGISTADQTKIFRMFSRLQHRDATTGNGIGLAFCRKIADLHGGELTVTSQPGEGSTFTLTLPKPTADEDQTKTRSTD